MTDDEILEIAKDCGFTLQPPPRLKDMGDGTLRFVSPTELTYFGQKLLNFGRALLEKAGQEGGVE